MKQNIKENKKANDDNLPFTIPLTEIVEHQVVSVQHIIKYKKHYKNMCGTLLAIKIIKHFKVYVNHDK